VSTATATPARQNRVPASGKDRVPASGKDQAAGSGNRAFPPRNSAPQRKFNRNFQKPGAAKDGSKPEAEILFQTYFKSVGPRTYAAQVKRAGNGNHFVVLTEGKRDDKTGEIRKTRLFIFSEDFTAFFKMLHETALFIRENPVSEEVRKKREKFWARNGEGSGSEEPKRSQQNTASPPAGAKVVERPRQASPGAGQVR
jgi:hypothetical protein